MTFLTSAYSSFIDDEEGVSGRPLSNNVLSRMVVLLLKTRNYCKYQLTFIFKMVYVPLAVHLLFLKVPHQKSFGIMKYWGV